MNIDDAADQTGTWVIRTDHFKAAEPGDSLYTTRKKAYQGWTDGKVKASIFVLAYNRLEKTRRCVQSILKYTEGIEYELILIDNGSCDGTLEFFHEVSYPRKKVWRITKNIGANFPLTLAMRQFEGEYFVYVPSDVYVTAHWLSNLLKCYESDPRVGLAVPVSNHISNLQEVGLTFDSYEEMQEKAAVFNHSDPAKWKERLRLMPIIHIFSREICDVAGTIDLGFYYDFADDDISARIRHAGYKLFLCADTFVCHDHDYRNSEDKDPVQFQKSLDAGRKNYRDKYFGIDAWEDINNYEINFMNLLFAKPIPGGNSSVLGIDVRCGTPILEIRNHLRERGVTVSRICAYTSQAKYFQDLQYTTDGNASCGRISDLLETYQENSFDYIFLGEPVNTYREPVKLAQNILRLVKKGGEALLKLRNTADVYAYLKMNGLLASMDEDMPAAISYVDFYHCLKAMGAQEVRVGTEPHPLDQATMQELEQAVRASGICKDVRNAVMELQVKEYLFCIRK